MQLDEFVQTTLSQIQDGVRQAQQATNSGDGIICPAGIFVDQSGESVVSTGNPPHVEYISFDVAVTVSEKSESGGKVGLFVMGVGGGLGKQSELLSSSISHIRFRIPVVLPSIPSTEEHLKKRREVSDRLREPTQEEEGGEY